MLFEIYFVVNKVSNKVIKLIQVFSQLKVLSLWVLEHYKSPVFLILFIKFINGYKQIGL